MKSTIHYSKALVTSQKIDRRRAEIRNADAILIGAGAGLFIAAGLSYSGKRFRRYFSDFADKYGMQDMYSGGFIPLTAWRNTGHGGADISGITATIQAVKRYTERFII